VIYRVGEKYLVEMDGKEIKIEINFIDCSGLIWIHECDHKWAHNLDQWAFSGEDANLYFKPLETSIEYVRKL